MDHSSKRKADWETGTETNSLDEQSSPPRKRSREDTTACSPKNTIDDLPREILEDIFGFLSIYSLNLCRLVHKSWNSIISEPQFLKWKKHYHSVKAGNTDHHLSEYITPISHSTFVKSLIQSVDNEFGNLSKYVLVKSSGVDQDSGFRVLKRFPQYDCVVTSLSLCPEMLSDNQKFLSYQACICLMILLSESVEDVLCLLNTLTSTMSHIWRITDLFYFCLYMFYQLWQRNELPQRHHYTVYHAMAVFERQSTSSIPSESKSFSLTSEQLKILKHELRPNETIKIVAFAGTGKTTTLVKMVEQNLSSKFIYAVFNKSMATVAQKLFTSKNVQCKTYHAIARQGVISHLKFSSTKLYNGSLETFHLEKFVDASDKSFKVKWLQTALENFFASDDDDISLQLHVPPIAEVIISAYQNEPSDINEGYRTKVFDLAKLIWKEMLNKENEKVLLPHDGYLKLFQLNKLVLSGYDCMLIDEAQDITPAMKAIIDCQPVTKIFVGDPHQKIYNFRGAVNSLDLIVPDHTFYLTQSFRFGPRIAYLASCVLSVVKNVHKQTITGTLKQDGYFGRIEGQVAFIGRTNHVLFETAVEMCRAYANATVAFTSRDRVLKDRNLLVDIYRLYRNKDTDQIKDQLIKKKLKEKNFSFSSYVTQAQRTDNYSVLSKIKLVEKYKDETLTHIDTLKTRIISDWRKADYVFTTAHKSKGLEFESVVVLDDYVSDFRSSAMKEDEKNLLYVAITRAKRQVFMNDSLLQILSIAKEHFMYFSNTGRIQEEFDCAVCCRRGNCPPPALPEEQEEPSPSSTIVSCHGVTTGFPKLSSVLSGSSFVGGSVCSLCSKNHFPYLGGIVK